MFLGLLKSGYDRAFDDVFLYVLEAIEEQIKEEIEILKEKQISKEKIKELLEELLNKTDYFRIKGAEIIFIEEQEFAEMINKKEFPLENYKWLYLDI